MASDPIEVFAKLRADGYFERTGQTDDFLSLEELEAITPEEQARLGIDLRAILAFGRQPPPPELLDELAET